MRTIDRTLLRPELNTLLTAFEAALVAAGYTVWFTQGFRSSEEQDALYAQGRTEPGDIVTNAQGGQSPHNFGLAFDICFPGKTQEACWPDDPELWEEVGKIGEAVGLTWGGRFKFVDLPHFQMPGWKTLIA